MGLSANHILNKYSEEEIAAQLCILDSTILFAIKVKISSTATQNWNLNWVHTSKLLIKILIKPVELLNQAWSKPSLKHRAPNVVKLSQTFNALSSYASYCVLMQVYFIFRQAANKSYSWHFWHLQIVKKKSAKKKRKLLQKE